MILDSRNEGQGAGRQSTTLPNRMEKYMQFSVKSGDITHLKTDCLVAGVFQDRKLTSTASTLNKASGGYLLDAMKDAGFKGQFGQLQMVLKVPGIAATVDMPRIMQHDYARPERVNPTSIVAVGPDLGILHQPHDRDRLPSKAAA